MNLIETFGNILGYKINSFKSTLIFLNENERLQPIVDTPFTTTNDCFTYLGIKISPDVTQMVSLNCDPLVDRVREMLS